MDTYQEIPPNWFVLQGLHSRFKQRNEEKRLRIEVGFSKKFT